MKLGGLIVIYLTFGIWRSVQRTTNVFLILGLAAIGCIVLSLIGRIMKSDRIITFWHRKLKGVAIIAIIGVVNMATWKPLLGLFFN